MTIKNLPLLGILSGLLALGLASSALAASKWCVPSPTGQDICFPVLVEEIRVKLPPQPGPLLPVDIRELSEALTEILNPDPSPWILRDALGERAFIVDFEAGQIFEIPQEQFQAGL